MEDRQIVALYHRREESAVAEDSRSEDACCDTALLCMAEDAFWELASPLLQAVSVRASSVASIKKRIGVFFIALSPFFAAQVQHRLQNYAAIVFAIARLLFRRFKKIYAFAYFLFFKRTVQSNLKNV